MSCDFGIYLAFTERKKADNKCQKERKMKFKKASKIKGLERKLKREKVNIYARNKMYPIDWTD